MFPAAFLSMAGSRPLVSSAVFPSNSTVGGRAQAAPSGESDLMADKASGILEPAIAAADMIKNAVRAKMMVRNAGMWNVSMFMWFLLDDILCINYNHSILMIQTFWQWGVTRPSKIDKISINMCGKHMYKCTQFFTHSTSTQSREGSFPSLTRIITCSSMYKYKVSSCTLPFFSLDRSLRSSRRPGQGEKKL